MVLSKPFLVRDHVEELRKRDAAYFVVFLRFTIDDARKIRDGDSVEVNNPVPPRFTLLHRIIVPSDRYAGFYVSVEVEFFF